MLRQMNKHTLTKTKTKQQQQSKGNQTSKDVEMEVYQCNFASLI